MTPHIAIRQKATFYALLQTECSCSSEEKEKEQNYGEMKFKKLEVKLYSKADKPNSD